MDYTHPEAFVDLDVLPSPKHKGFILCPKCKGHGKWHLALDVYGKGKHHDMSCSQCDSVYGYSGWVHKDDLCMHAWELLSSDGRFYTEECVHCNLRRTYDTGD
jgi:uncharacterized Zn-finger protein